MKEDLFNHCNTCLRFNHTFDYRLYFDTKKGWKKQYQSKRLKTLELDEETVGVQGKINF
jgi:hypothetical protein